MKTVLIACRTIEEELTRAMEETGVCYPVTWLASGLHNTPKKLTAMLQAALDDIAADRVLLAMGFCGNSMAGLFAGDHELILPRADDCITLLLGSMARRSEISREYAAYFFTEGWLRGERNILVEHQYMMEKYGAELTAELERSMFGSYRSLGLLDCGFKPIQPLIDATREIAVTLNLRQQVIPANLCFLTTLLTGPWSADRFVRISAGATILAKDLTARP